MLYSTERSRGTAYTRWYVYLNHTDTTPLFQTNISLKTEKINSTRSVAEFRRQQNHHDVFWWHHPKSAGYNILRCENTFSPLNQAVLCVPHVRGAVGSTAHSSMHTFFRLAQSLSSCRSESASFSVHSSNAFWHAK